MPRHPRPVIERFDQNIEIQENGCWVWKGKTDHWGYGVIKVGGRLFLAHRLSYELHKGPIPPGMFAYHTCDNPPCVNPDHLFLGSKRDNVQDGIRKGRYPVDSEKPNTKLSDEQVVEIRRRYSLERITQAALASEYQVSQQQISKVISRLHFRYL